MSRGEPSPPGTCEPAFFRPPGKRSGSGEPMGNGDHGSGSAREVSRRAGRALIYRVLRARIAFTSGSGHTLSRGRRRQQRCGGNGPPAGGGGGDRGPRCRWQRDRCRGRQRLCGRRGAALDVRHRRRWLPRLPRRRWSNRDARLQGDRAVALHIQRREPVVRHRARSSRSCGDRRRDGRGPASLRHAAAAQGDRSCRATCARRLSSQPRAVSGHRHEYRTSAPVSCLSRHLSHRRADPPIPQG